MLSLGACQTEEILGDVDAAVRVVLDCAERAPDTDLLLFPEAFLQGYLVTGTFVREQAMALDSPAFGAVLGRLAGIRQTLVLGMIESSGEKLHNTAVVVSGGRLLGFYRKTFLTEAEAAVFAPGDSYPTFECGGVRFGINICFDSRFAGAAAGVAARGARLLLVSAQNMMRTANALVWREKHNEIRAERARETGMWLASADVTGRRDGERVGLGPTCVMDPDGRVVARVPEMSTGIARWTFA